MHLPNFTVALEFLQWFRDGNLHGGRYGTYTEVTRCIAHILRFYVEGDFRVKGMCDRDY